jgi:hypothetical protein
LHRQGRRVLQGGSRACWGQLEAGLLSAGLHSSSSSSNWILGCSAAAEAAAWCVAVQPVLLRLVLMVILLGTAIPAECMLQCMLAACVCRALGCGFAGGKLLVMMWHVVCQQECCLHGEVRPLLP